MGDRRWAFPCQSFHATPPPRALQAKSDPEGVIRQFESGVTPASDQSVAEYVKARVLGCLLGKTLPWLHHSGSALHNACVLTVCTSSHSRRWSTPTGWTRTR